MATPLIQQPPASAVTFPDRRSGDRRRFNGNSRALLLTVEEAALRLRIGRTTAYALIASGDLESVPVGRLRRVPTEALSAYVARLRQASASPHTTSEN